MRRVITSFMKSSSVIDPDFDSVVLLLDFAGNDGATNITDLSDRGHVETFVAEAQVDTDQQFLGKNSLLFDGTGDRVSYPVNADWDFGSDDFTIEIGVRFAVVNTIQSFISTYDGSSPSFTIQFRGGEAEELRFLANGSDVIATNWDPVVDTWYHIAVARSGTDVRMFVDGVQIGGTATDSTLMAIGAKKLFIGHLRDDSPVQGVNGNIGAVRITKGVGRYTANFTPPTVFYPLVGPAAATDPDFSSVVLLLDFAGNDGATDITDLSDSAHVETFVASAAIDVDHQYLLGNGLKGGPPGDRITYADSADWDFGTGDFTLELGVSVDIADVNYGALSTIDVFGEGTGNWYVQLSSGGSGELRFGHGGGVLIQETWVMTVNRWYHLVVTRTGTDLRAFLDGVQLGSTVTNSTDFNGGSRGLWVGGLTDAFQQALDGSIGAVRITKGVGRYTANFTPPIIFYPTS